MTNEHQMPSTPDDVGPYPLYSTALLIDDPAAHDEKIAREQDYRRTRLFFNYSIGGTISGAGTVWSADRLPATPLETNMRVANQLVDERAQITSVDLVIPRITQAVYQLNPSAGPYEVTEKDVAMIATCACCCFYCGGNKPFVEAPLAQRVIAPLGKEVITRELPPILASVGGWIVQLADLSAHPLPIGRIEKFWGDISFPRDFPTLGRHGYNPAVVAVVMVLHGLRVRRVA